MERTLISSGSLSNTFRAVKIGNNFQLESFQYCSLSCIAIPLIRAAATRSFNGNDFESLQISPKSKLQDKGTLVPTNQGISERIQYMCSISYRTVRHVPEVTISCRRASLTFLGGRRDAFRCWWLIAWDLEFYRIRQMASVSLFGMSS